VRLRAPALPEALARLDAVAALTTHTGEHHASLASTRAQAPAQARRPAPNWWNDPSQREALYTWSHPAERE
jgi:hypothetical protein